MNRFNFISFFAGIVFCAITISIFGFKTLTNEFQDGGINQVGIEQANSLKANYKAQLPQDPVGYNVSVEQWQAINTVFNEMGGSQDNPSGFRVMHGLTSDFQRVSLVYTLNRDRKEPSQGGSTNSSNKVAMAQGFHNDFTDQCPPYCD